MCHIAQKVVWRLDVSMTTQWENFPDLFVYRNRLSNMSASNGVSLVTMKRWRTIKTALGKTSYRRGTKNNCHALSMEICCKPVSNCCNQWIKKRPSQPVSEDTLWREIHAINIWSIVTRKRQLLTTAHYVTCLKLATKYQK